MSRTLLAGLLAFCLASCATADATERLQNGRAETAADVMPFTRTLPSGTRVTAIVEEQLSSRRAGEVVRAKLGRDVTDSRGSVVIPAGTLVLLSIEDIAEDSVQQSAQGRISLLVTTVNKSGVSYSLYGTLDTRPSERDASNAVMVAAGTPVVITLTQALNYER